MTGLANQTAITRHNFLLITHSEKELHCTNAPVSLCAYFKIVHLLNYSESI